MGQKDVWNAREPAGDKNFVPFVERPELAGLLPVLYPGVFPNLAALSAPRADLVAILLTGIPSGLIPGFQNFTGTKPADLLRLNTAITPASNPSVFGLLGGDLAGFPNGRRVFDDVVAIELRAIAGATYPLVDGSFTPDAAASAVDDGVGPDDVGMPYLDRFPLPGSAPQRFRRSRRSVMTADALVVDIGGDTGALIVYAPPVLVGREIEIARADTSSGHPVHNVVRPRRVGPWVVHAAVFPGLPAGTYTATATASGTDRRSPWPAVASRRSTGLDLGHLSWRHRRRGDDLTTVDEVLGGHALQSRRHVAQERGPVAGSMPARRLPVTPREVCRAMNSSRLGRYDQGRPRPRSRRTRRCRAESAACQGCPSARAGR